AGVLARDLDTSTVDTHFTLSSDHSRDNRAISTQFGGEPAPSPTPSATARPSRSRTTRSASSATRRQATTPRPAPPPTRATPVTSRASRALPVRPAAVLPE